MDSSADLPRKLPNTDIVLSTPNRLFLSHCPSDDTRIIFICVDDKVSYIFSNVELLFEVLKDPLLFGVDVFKSLKNSYSNCINKSFHKQLGAFLRDKEVSLFQLFVECWIVLKNFALLTGQ